jgi:hypothetical protein
MNVYSCTLLFILFYYFARFRTSGKEKKVIVCHQHCYCQTISLHAAWLFGRILISWKNNCMPSFFSREHNLALEVWHLKYLLRKHMNGTIFPTEIILVICLCWETLDSIIGEVVERSTLMIHLALPIFK